MLTPVFMFIAVAAIAVLVLRLRSKSSGPNRQRGGMPREPSVERVRAKASGEAPGEVDYQPSDETPSEGEPDPSLITEESGTAPATLDDHPVSRVPTEKRGGRYPEFSREFGVEAESERSSVFGEQSSQSFSAELVTWKSGGRQRFGVEVVCDGEPEIYVGDERVNADARDANRCELKTLEPIVVVCGEHRRVIEPGNSPLFKLHESNRGRRVACLTRGNYLLLAPAGSQLSVTSSSVPILIPGYVAMLFWFTEGSAVPSLRLPCGAALAFRTAGVFGLSSPAFSTPTDQRGFYLGKPPQLRFVEPVKEGTVVVVGLADVEARRSWRTKGLIPAGAIECQLEGLLADTLGGWFYVRVYEDDSVLMDSDQFVYLPDVGEIIAGPYDVLPGPNGHEAIEVTVAHGPGVNVEAPGLLPATDDEGTRISAPPDPTWDKVTIIIGGERRSPVRLELDLSRLWFRGDGHGHGVDDSWSDRPLRLAYADFTPEANRTVSLRIPLRLLKTEVWVGFSRERAKKYTAHKTSRIVSVPLKLFYSEPEIQTPGVERRLLMVWLGDSREGVALACVQPELPVIRRTAWGRSKNVKALAMIRSPGDGRILCDGHELDRSNPTVSLGCSLLHKLQSDQRLVSFLACCRITITTYGGNPCSERRSKAAAHATARAVALVRPDLKPYLKSLGLGGARVRMAREKERIARETD